MKQCIKCCRILDETEFWYRNKELGYLQSACKSCKTNKCSICDKSMHGTKRSGSRYCSPACTFTANTEVVGKCLKWTGGTDKDGYGLIWDNKQWRAHIWIAYKTWGYKPIQVLHRCDNTGCVNIEHLFPGDNYTNQVDSRDKGRNPMHKLNTEAVKVIKWALNQKYSRRRLAEVYGVSICTINDIISGRSWSEIEVNQ